MIRPLCILLGMVGCLSQANAAAPAFDSAADPIYDSGWPQGINSGYGFTPLSASAYFGNSGYFIGNSSGNGNPPSGDINSAGRAWGLYANSGGISEAGRGFTAGGPNNANTLAPGQVFTIQFDTGYVDSSTNGEVGFTLDGSLGAAFHFYFFGGRGIYFYSAGSGFRYPNIQYTNNGLTVSLVLGYSGNFMLLATVNGGSSYKITDSFGADPNILAFQVYNMYAGAGSSHDLFFNRTSVANVPVATAVDRSAAGFVVHFVADANRTYRLERNSELTETGWQPVEGVSDFTASTSGPAQLTDPNGAALTRAFYHVRMLLP